jgi:hypothetical protein
MNTDSFKASTARTSWSIRPAPRTCTRSKRCWKATTCFGVSATSTSERWSHLEESHEARALVFVLATGHGGIMLWFLPLPDPASADSQGAAIGKIDQFRKIGRARYSKAWRRKIAISRYFPVTLLNGEPRGV